ncbi:MAG: hypothetical protein UT63_C0018G0007 [Candidatus Gottesmanbacteria bacterium GW2011_GWC2_39_8]|uniref:Uncharacterized protein n=1 Tax=Candidatus Gottesmanbacteria bacterium GW2011_GWC2_39_8 TaxID=1618450 RepID=A0A0G0T6B2_9BACT|nr:MAG: hypothetical protein UT63_C0018G0007 [Candidatus Gottesmanbacteria bacterium GW2011_GWC2_39_8]
MSPRIYVENRGFRLEKLPGETGEYVHARAGNLVAAASGRMRLDQPDKARGYLSSLGMRLEHAEYLVNSALTGRSGAAVSFDVIFERGLQEGPGKYTNWRKDKRVRKDNPLGRLWRRLRIK